MPKKIKIGGSFLEDEDGNDYMCDKIFVTPDNKAAWGLDADGNEVFRLRGINGAVLVTGVGGGPSTPDKTLEERVADLEAQH